MRRLLYYVQGRFHPSPDALTASGLGHLVGLSLDSRGVDAGPDGKAGAILGAAGSTKRNGSAPPPLGYRKDSQRWQCEPEGRWWVGVDNDSLPGPAELARPMLADGYHVELADGNKWVVPVARSVVTGATSLPQAIVLGDRGQVITEELPAYLSLCKAAERFWSDFRAAAREASEGHDQEMTIADCWRVVAEALGVNYRVSQAEVSLLRLVTTSHVMKVMLTLIDWPAIEAVTADLKKKESPAIPDTPRTDAGGPGDAEPITSPPSPSSTG